MSATPETCRKQHSLRTEESSVGWWPNWVLTDKRRKSNKFSWTVNVFRTETKKRILIVGVTAATEANNQISAARCTTEKCKLSPTIYCILVRERWDSVILGRLLVAAAAAASRRTVTSCSLSSDDDSQTQCRPLVCRDYCTLLVLLLLLMQMRFSSDDRRLVNACDKQRRTIVAHLSHRADFTRSSYDINWVWSFSEYQNTTAKLYIKTFI